MFLEDSAPKLETEDALRTLAASTCSGPRIRLKALSPEGRLRDVASRLPDLRDADKFQYIRWIDRLSGMS